jgi:hypothetical protein
MAVAAPARRSSPAPAPSRTTPPRKRAAPRVRPKPKRAAPPALALAGRTAVAVGQLPDSGLIVRMTRGRAWIGVLGLLLVGIVALNVVTLSFAASSGKVDAQITALEKESRLLGGREAVLFGNDRIRHEAAAAGLAMPTTQEPRVVEAGPGDVAAAAQRLAAAGAG